MRSAIGAPVAILVSAWMVVAATNGVRLLGGPDAARHLLYPGVLIATWLALLALHITFQQRIAWLRTIADAHRRTTLHDPSPAHVQMRYVPYAQLVHVRGQVRRLHALAAARTVPVHRDRALDVPPGARSRQRGRSCPAPRSCPAFTASVAGRAMHGGMRTWPIRRPARAATRRTWPSTSTVSSICGRRPKRPKV
jgi:hypothetical protein